MESSFLSICQLLALSEKPLILAMLVNENDIAVGVGYH
jgi:hypothetical protein